MKLTKMTAALALLALAEIGKADPLDQWTRQSPPPGGTSLSGITYGNGQFVAVGAGPFIATSTDGANWVQHQGPATLAGDLFQMSISYGSGQFVAVGSGYTEQSLVIISSADGVNWVQRLVGPRLMTDDKYSIAYGNGQFVVVPYRGWHTGATSKDGVNWVLAPPWSANSGCCVEAVTYGDGQFVAVGDYGTIITSTNGMNWVSQQSDTTDHSLLGAAYGNGEFVAVGSAPRPGYGTSPAILSSADGVKWVPRQPRTAYSFDSVAFGMGQFVAVGDTIVTSSDGVNWVERQ